MVFSGSAVRRDRAAFSVLPIQAARNVAHAACARFASNQPG